MQAIDRAADHAAAIGMLCSSPSFPSSTVSLLLRHRSAAVRAAVVEGCWYRLNAAPQDAELGPAWTEAVLGMRGGYVLKQILQKDLGLAERWILMRLERPSTENVDFDEERVMQEIAPGLSVDARRRFIAAVREGRPAHGDTLLAFIGDDVASCRHLFARKELRHVHDEMLEGNPDAAWRMRARAAIDAGYEPHDIARISFYGVNHFKGSHSEHWRARAAAFEALLIGESDSALQAALREGVRLAEERAAQAVEREQHEEVFGDL